jgi:hypothetical protein
MNGGTISNNTSDNDDGGGVHVSGPTTVSHKFTMNGGTISNNNGGGVLCDQRGTFTMNDGTISGNKGYLGGGVYVCSGDGPFTMYGGTISGNTGTMGGGVYVGGWAGKFTMYGGVISGNTGGYGGGVTIDGGTFLIVSGTIYGSNEVTASFRNTASRGASLYLDLYSGTAQRGTFSGSTWNSLGSLSTTDNTIRVVNGALQ